MDVWANLPVMLACYGYIILLIVVAVSMAATVAEAVSPRGLDNVAVPALGALTFIVMGGDG